jgi:outer membrane protein assembly factor BamE
MKKILIMTLLLGGCGYIPVVPPLLTPYKIDIQQGNYVTQDMIAKLKPGMSRSQVRFALGTPLIIDPFHPERWDYVYTMQKGGKLVEQRTVTVVFKGDELERIDGDVVAGNKDGATDQKAGTSAAQAEKK